MKFSQRPPSQVWREWGDRIEFAMAHPDLFPPPKVIHGLPEDDELLGLYAHHPTHGEDVLARIRRHEADALKAEGLTHEGPVPVQHHARSRAAVGIARHTPLTIDQALAVVRKHGLGIRPDQAVAAWSTMNEEAPCPQLDD